MLVPIDKHCVAIALILERVQAFPDWEGVHDWLMTAGSIKSVEVDTVQHDEGFGMCSAADEFSMAREKLINAFVFDLTVFSFSWGALEAVIDVAAPPKHPNKAKRGKIRDACRFLEQAFAYRGHVIGLADEVQSFRKAALECWERGS